MSTQDSKSQCKNLFGDLAQSGAKKLCGIGDCICDYECGHLNRGTGPFKFPGPKTGTEKCPLEKYGISPEQNPKPWWERHRSEMEPSEEELFALCACCDNADVEAKGDTYTAHRKDLHACFGCPVKTAEEAMQEAAAEARCS